VPCKNKQFNSWEGINTGNYVKTPFCQFLLGLKYLGAAMPQSTSSACLLEFNRFSLVKSEEPTSNRIKAKEKERFICEIGVGYNLKQS